MTNSKMNKFEGATKVRYVSAITGENEQLAAEHLTVGAEYPVDTYDDSPIAQMLFGGTVLNVKVREQVPQMWTVTDEEASNFEVVE